jgi:hypothetical protein
MLNIEFKWPSVQKKYFHTNYANIDSVVSDIVQYKGKNGCTRILIPDVSFSDNKDALDILYNTFERVTVIDHHMYNDGFWDAYARMKVIHDKTKSATLLCNEYLGNAGCNANLDNLSYVIDIYDLWKDKHDFFSFAQDLNEYFWSNGKFELFRKIISNGYKLPPDFTQKVKEVRDKYTAAIEDFEKRKVIQRFSDVTIAFVDDWFNQILIGEMRKGQNFVIGLNSQGICKMRINQDAPYSDDQLNGIRYDLTGKYNYGHLHAFTYKVQNVSLENLMNEVKKIVSVLDKHCLVK